LEQRGQYRAHSPKEVFRLAALEKMIEDPVVWFDFLKKRNITVHSYNEGEVESVLSILDQFVEKVDMFIYKITVRQLDLEDRDRAIIEDILKKYPYSFYAFGSRVSGKNKKTLSDLDLCFFDSISHVVQQKIQTNFEESDLPYKIDLIDWSFCSEEFRHLIMSDLMCLHASDILYQVEKNVFEYVKYLPKKLGFDVSEGVIHCGLNTSKFNIILNNSDPELISTQEPWSWWLGPSYHYLKFQLPHYGFQFKLAGYPMVCLDYQPQVLSKEIRECRDLSDFISLIEIQDPKARLFYEKIKDINLYPQQKFFVGYEGREPVVCGILFIQDKDASIFSVTTKKAYRHRGWGTQMTLALMNEAHKQGCDLISLIATSKEGLSIYQKLNFKAVGLFECFDR
jgi:uncharacterized protein